MITKFNLFIIEGIAMSNEEIVEILKSLETEDNKNSALINRLVNKVDNNGKSVLMTIVQSNNEELVDYILKFNVDINHTIKTGENVLFFCKNIKMFKKFYDLGADVHSINIHTKQNILSYLASKKIFNVEIYQKLIDDGVEIMGDLICKSILNKGIVELLIKNKVDLNNRGSQHYCLNILLNELRYYKNKKGMIFNIFKLLFNNGMEITDNAANFAEMLINLRGYPDYSNDLILEFINKLNMYITDDMIVEIYKKYLSTYRDSVENIVFAKKLLNINLSIKLYNFLKQCYRGSTPSFYEAFADFIKENPVIEDSIKYNM